ncbi:alpha/beta hydrolase [Nocardia huaxiensis]|nr:alpha/beta hydrolase family protein [Nocardia huaxiensis]UFS93977.1 esterase family protein [Nocardia huaxiensis]
MRTAVAAMVTAVSLSLGGQALAEPQGGNPPAGAPEGQGPEGQGGGPKPQVTIPSVRSADGSYIKNIVPVDARTLHFDIYSAAMDTVLPVEVMTAGDTSVSRPNLYLLSGADGGAEQANWQGKTDAMQFLSDKNVNVIQILGGGFSFYTDWLKPDPKLGVYKYDTYIGKELPTLMDAALNSNGVNAIAGLSMSGLSVLNLVTHNPGLFRAAAVYSGLTQTSDPIAQEAVRLTVNDWGGGTYENMWGTTDNPLWVENDPTVQAEKLRGVELFVSTGNGIPGAYDLPSSKWATTNTSEYPKTIALGMIIEGAINLFNHNFEAKLNSLGIPATFVYRNVGLHSWGYWQDDLKTSWEVLERGLNSAP